METAKPLDLDQFKEQLLISNTGKNGKGDSFNSIGSLNAAAWIGENSGCLIGEIERLRSALSNACILMRTVAPHAPNTSVKDKNKVTGEWLVVIGLSDTLKEAAAEYEKMIPTQAKQTKAKPNDQNSN